MSEPRSVQLSSSGPPETVLEEAPVEARHQLEQALGHGSDAERRNAVAEVVAQWPRFLAAWASLGDLGRDIVESYAAYRVGYHRGLDQLRASGWRGSGFVRWQHPTNQGFLRSLEGLRRTAEQIGETDEAERCLVFLRQLDPEWPPTGLPAGDR